MRPDTTKAWLIVLAAAAVLPVLSSCVPHYGYANNRAGRESRAAFCDSVRHFVRAPLDSAGLRRAWFLPMGSREVGDNIEIDLYAPMIGKPSDEESHAFYKNEVGRLTHYTTSPEHGFEMAKCLSGRYDFERKALEMQEELLRASFVDIRLKRRIEIAAEDDSTTIFIASMEWSGDLAETMRYRCAEECQ